MIKKLVRLSKNTALLLIDIQKGLDEHSFYGGNRNNLEAEVNAAKILAHWRKNGQPVFHVRHSSQNIASPLHASKPGFDIKEGVKPLDHEPLFTKNVNSAFIGTDLEQVLRDKSIKSVVVVGLTTNHCVSTSVRMAANLGFETVLVSDACAAFDQKGVNGQTFDAELVHQTALASLKDEFAQIVSTAQLLE
ncbi:MAG: cysteine hydrolase [Muricauda sp.]|nr:cysteine hydrolase family protein [Allomuricauda sp.]MAU26815.1 cysteine hydrolase [Allomuricauda sp.]MBC31692.1 cysteine hydrolase [Allomuricauda sp.]|tara:strand:- start:8664 stop:9236 length:573 start_codon:yes stop_codon:yes gene_type:complete